MQTTGYAVDSPTGKFHPLQFNRREVGDDDVLIKILFCGICHSDIHSARSEWGPSNYPLIPGHEIVGVVEKVGSKVTKVKVGDNAAVGCLVDACFSCGECKKDEENFCPDRILTFGAKDRDGSFTHGGYSTQIVLKEKCTLTVSTELGKKLEAVAPLLCAGITTYSPFVHWKEKVVGKKVGVVRLGGLGHLGVKIAKAMGAEVTVFSTSENKREAAIKLGASHFVNTKDEKQMKAIKGTQSFILNTVSAVHDIVPYIDSLENYGALVYVGMAPEALKLPIFSLIGGNKIIAGSNIGGIKETQEMLDFCSSKGVFADVEVIKANQIDEAYDRTVISDVRYRFVIDVNSMRA